MIPVDEEPATPQEGIPRESGDDPWLTWPMFTVLTVFPARAGMIPQVSPSWLQETSIPRESGDDPLATTAPLPS